MWIFFDLFSNLFYVIYPVKFIPEDINQFQDKKDYMWPLTYKLFMFAQETGGIPTNAFPSFHFALQLTFSLFMFSVYKLKFNNFSWWEFIIFWFQSLSSILIWLSTIFCKKHYVVDGLFSFVIVFIAYYFIDKFIKVDINRSIWTIKDKK